MNRFNIGRRIEVYREKRNMSTQELAERINRSQATISRIENGKQGITFELLAQIAGELKIHPFSLLCDEPLRHSVLLPPSDERSGEYTPSLLANALHSGRVSRKMTTDAAAKLADVSACELEAIELAIICPDDALLDKLCALYGLAPDEMRILRRLTEVAPDRARGLAYLQHLFSNIRRMIANTPDGGASDTLDRIVKLIDSSDTEHPIPPDSSADDINLFLNRLAMHVINALKDRDFRGKMVALAESEEKLEQEKEMAAKAEKRKNTEMDEVVETGQ